MNRGRKLIVVLFIVLLVISGCKDSKLKNYKVVSNEMEETKTGEKLQILAQTEEEFNKEEIEKVLYDILNNNVSSDNKNEDIYIGLSEDTFFLELGYLKVKDGKTEIVAYEKDWDNKPTELDMRIANKKIEKAQKSFDLESIIRSIALEEDLEVEDVRESLDKVRAWGEKK